MDQPSSTPQASNRPRSISRLVPMLLLLASSSCGLWPMQRPRLTAPMPVPAPLRKQVLQGYMPFGSIGWVSNDQVVFSGLPTGSRGKHALYLWRLKEKPRLLLRNSPGGCIRERSIRARQLWSQGKDKTYTFSGPDFNPQLASIAPFKGAGVFDPVSCSWIRTPAVLQDHAWQPLRLGQGFLDFTPEGRASGPLWAVEHLDADARTRRDTGIRMPKPMIPMAVHAPHDDSYLVFDLHQSAADEQRWLEAKHRDIWRLDRQLRSQKLSIPAGPWVGIGAGTISFLPARPGVLITSNNFARNGSAGGAGLYLWRPGAAAQRLETGLVQKAAVSPDGCRLAYGFKPRLDTGLPEGGPRLVVLDLCARSRDRRRGPEQTG